MFELVEKRAPTGSLINDFRGDHSWLSNFSDSALLWQNIYYPTVEHAFQAGKTLDMNLRQQIADAPTPQRAKQLGWSLTPQPGWRDRVRHEVMAEVLAAKFTIPTLAEQLRATGSALLVEGNDWCDNDWGWCRCRKHSWRPGLNLLGRALMRQRAILDPSLVGRWTRVAVTGHRPHRIPARQRPWVQDKLGYVTDKLVGERGMEVALSGLAMGTDQWFAEAALTTGARVWGYSPYPEQDARWPQIWQDRRRRIIDTAERVEYLAANYSNAHLFGRNTWLIRDADALVCVADTSRTTGGTISALRQARDRIPIVLIDLHDEAVRLVRPRAA